MSGSGPSLAPAIITAVVSVIALAINYQIGIRGLRHSAARDIAKLALEFKLQKLNLFGRLLLLTDRSKMLYEKLIEGKPEGWHLLRHVDEVLASDVDRNLAVAILQVNTTNIDIKNAYDALQKDVDATLRRYERMLRDIEEEGQFQTA